MMHYLLAVVGLFVSGINAVSWDAKFVQNFESLDHVSIFQEWKEAFGKSYVGPEEEARKFLIWLDNWRQIIAHNHDYSNTFTKKMNQFGDLTADEFRYYVHGSNGACYNRKSASNKTPFVSALKDGMSKLKAEFPDLAAKDTQNVDAPDSVDWSAEGKVTPVKNQGQCGSCWAFSTTGSLECDYAIQKGTLRSLSEQQLVDCSGSYGNMGCNGGLMDDAFKYVEAEGGLCEESAYPYTAEDGSCKATSCGTKYNANSGYKDVTHDSETSLLTAAASGCVSIAIEADQSSFQFYSSGVLSGRCGTSLDHGVLVVGYGSQSGTDYWKVKNSWGTTWGEEGYVLICRNCDKNGSQGECGILDEPSYPTFS